MVSTFLKMLEGKLDELLEYFRYDYKNKKTNNRSRTRQRKFYLYI